MAESTTPQTLRMTAEAEILRRRELTRIYRSLLSQANAVQEEANRLRASAQSVYNLIDDKSIPYDTMADKSEAQIRRDAARALRSVAANLEKDVA